jgi:hypothetical protein
MDDTDTNNYDITVDEKEVWSLAFKVFDLSIFLMPSLELPTFDSFFALSVRWSFFDRHFNKSTSVEQDAEYAMLVLHW